MKYLNQMIVTALVLASASVAFADGFVCTSNELNIKVYNNTKASAGTRSAAVLVASNPQSVRGNQTLARFTKVQGSLSSYGTHYLAELDNRISDINYDNEIIEFASSQIQTIALDIDFNYNMPVPAGQVVPGLATLILQNGERHQIRLDCERYLKN